MRHINDDFVSANEAVTGMSPVRVRPPGFLYFPFFLLAKFSSKKFDPEYLDNTVNMKMRINRGEL